MFRVGEVFDGLRVEAEIGQGALGTVFRAVRDVDGAAVAVKALHEPLAGDPTFVAAFAAAAQLAQHLVHPNVARTLGQGTHRGVPYIASQYVVGQPLAVRLVEGGAADSSETQGELETGFAFAPGFQVGEVISILRQVAGALAAAERIGLVHRNLRPENIVQTSGGHVTLLDFGISKDVGREARAPVLASQISGTPAYMSPEQAAGPGAIDMRSDLYSLGAVAYELLSGRTPFEALSPTAYAEAHLKETPRPLADRDPSIPIGLSQVVDRLLSKDPDARHQNPRELLEDLDRVERGDAPLVVPGGSKQMPWKAIGIAAAAVLLLAAGAAVLLHLRGKWAQEEADDRAVAAAIETAQTDAEGRQYDAALADLAALETQYGDRPEVRAAVEKITAGRRAAHDEELATAQRALAAATTLAACDAAAKAFEQARAILDSQEVAGGVRDVATKRGDLETAYGKAIERGQASERAGDLESAGTAYGDARKIVSGTKREERPLALLGDLDTRKLGYATAMALAQAALADADRAEEAQKALDDAEKAWSTRFAAEGGPGLRTGLAHQRHLARAQAAEAERRWDDAVAAYAEALAIRTTNAGREGRERCAAGQQYDAALKSANRCLGLGAWDDAQKWFEEARQRAAVAGIAAPEVEKGLVSVAEGRTRGAKQQRVDAYTAALADARTKLDAEQWSEASRAFATAEALAREAGLGVQDAQAGQVRAAARKSILADLGSWDSAPSDRRKLIADRVAALNPGFRLKGLETFTCGSQSHEVATFVHAKTGLEFTLIPAGTFRMGSPTTERGRQAGETLHTVTLTKPFLLARTECSQAAWSRVKAPGAWQWRGANLPAESVSWDEAAAWCRAAGLRLPTEAEWEHACRAGEGAAYAFGGNSRTLGRHGNVCDLAVKRAVKGGKLALPDGRSWDASGFSFSTDVDDGHTFSSPVGSFAPNGFGLYDTHGNVWEWCSDGFAKYPKGAATDPTGPAGNAALRVYRGGCWANTAEWARSAFRTAQPAETRDPFLGFRPACSVKLGD